MATRGRKKPPPKLRIAVPAEGPDAGARKGDAPVKPPTIVDDPTASAEWDRVVAALAEREAPDPADLAILVVYCSAYSRVAEYRAVLLAEGPTVRTGLGGIKAHPLIGPLNSAERSLASFAAALGLDDRRVEEPPAALTPFERLTAQLAEARSKYARPGRDET